MADGMNGWTNGSNFIGVDRRCVQILPRFPRQERCTNDLAAAAFLIPHVVMASRIIAERTFEFGCRIVKLCERLWNGGPASRKVADQLFDCGTSIGANAEEAQGGQTKADFL